MGGKNAPKHAELAQIQPRKPSADELAALHWPRRQGESGREQMH